MLIQGNIIETIYNYGLTKDLIEIWETGHYSEGSKVENILTPDDLYWDSNSIIKEPAFVIHFKKHFVHSRQYSFRSTDLTDRYLISWKVFGSFDNQSWVILDEISENYEFRGQSYKTIIFPMKESTFSWYKFTFQKTNWAEITVYLSQVELYGTAMEGNEFTINSLISIKIILKLSAMIFWT